MSFSYDMDIVNQPNSAKLGDKLKELLVKTGTDRFDLFFIIAAYVKSSGVLHLKEQIEEFRRNGGVVRAVVGIDQKNSSKQGIELLNQICDEVYIYHNRSYASTFHPKMYLFEKSGQKAIVFIGSNNLTEGGLYTNYELTGFEELNLTVPNQEAKLNNLKQIFSEYSDTSSDKCKRVTDTLISELLDRHLIGDESLLEENQESPTRQAVSENTGNLEPIFGSETFRPPSRPRLSRQSNLTEDYENEEEPMTERTSPSSSVHPTSVITPPTSTPVLSHGQLIWKKTNLPKSDILQAGRSGTNPTGGLRLTQAQGGIGGVRIDQTTYFRNQVFGDFYWSTVRRTPYVEGCSVLFKISINGIDQGQFRLLLRHKPTGEAGQANYTTSLSWGDASSIIIRQNLTGKELRLYEPAPGTHEPFFIDIS